MKEVKVTIPDKKDFEKGMVELLKMFLDTETKAKIYLYLRKKGRATAEEIAEGAMLYPSSVREALVQMTEGGILRREKIEQGKAGKNPYIYEAIPATELTKKKIKELEEELNKIFNLDNYLKEKKEISLSKIKITIEKLD